MLGPIFQTFRKRLLIFRYRKVELMDLRSVFTTVICSFESFKKSNWSFSKCEILSVVEIMRVGSI